MGHNICAYNLKGRATGCNLTGNWPAMARSMRGTSINPRPPQYFNEMDIFEVGEGVCAVGGGIAGKIREPVKKVG